MVRGESQKSEYIGKMGGRTVLGGLIGEGPNSSYNRDLMYSYRDMYQILEVIKNNASGAACLGNRSSLGLEKAY